MTGGSGTPMLKLITYKTSLYYLVFAMPFFVFISIVVAIIGQNIVPTGLYGISISEVARRAIEEVRHREDAKRG